MFIAVLGWLCIFISVGASLVDIAQGLGSNDPQQVNEYNPLTSLLSFSVLAGSGVSLLFMASVLNAITQIRDNSRYMLLEMSKRNGGGSDEGDGS